MKESNPRVDALKAGAGMWKARYRTRGCDWRIALGTYSTEFDALSAAEAVLAAINEPRQCTPREIDVVRGKNKR